jgi:hypothetical protein
MEKLVNHGTYSLFFLSLLAGTQPDPPTPDSALADRQRQPCSANRQR